MLKIGSQRPGSNPKPTNFKLITEKTTRHNSDEGDNENYILTTNDVKYRSPTTKCTHAKIQNQ